MSVTAMAWAWEQDLEPTSKIILLSIADVADDSGIACCTNLDLALRCCVSERTVINHIKSLLSDGHLIVQKREGKPSVFAIPLLSLGVQNVHPSAFDQFWQLYPNKVGKQQCAKKWKTKRLDALANRILKDVAWKRDNDQRWLAGYIPNPLTYLNQERWDDEVVEVMQRDQSAASIAQQWRQRGGRVIEGDALDECEQPKRLTHH